VDTPISGRAIGAAPVKVAGEPRWRGGAGRAGQLMPFDQFIAASRRTRSATTSPSPLTTRHQPQALAPLDADLGTLDEYLTRDPGMMWMGPAGTFTPLHFDLTNNLIVQVVGAKRVIMSPPSQTPKLYNHRHVFSAVHDITDEARLNHYPRARSAQTIEVDLEAGDILFMPIGWWHQVTALDFSVSLTYTNFRWPNEGSASFPTD
jgi:hypothetical protein